MAKSSSAVDVDRRCLVGGCLGTVPGADENILLRALESLAYDLLVLKTMYELEVHRVYVLNLGRK